MVAEMVLANDIKALETETVNFWDRQDCGSDETESVLFSHKLSDASTAAGPEVVTAVPARKVAEVQGTKGKRKSSAAHARGKHGPISGLRSELRAQGQQIMKDLSMPAQVSKRQPRVPAKMMPCHRSLAQHAGKLSPPPGLPPPPRLQVAPSLGYDSGFSGRGRFGSHAPGTCRIGNEQVVMSTRSTRGGTAVPPSAASASRYDEDLFTELMLKARWCMLRNETQEEMLVLGPLSL
eukprot:TRINITY_DN6928_c0_g1_i1.p1 TRINITY_DN6928_c0_g1~~TRINITY_DN6928_c0_g1_i1.p1  ORF type:complete len:236 (+),score=58.01 TRINITY_DN6928_c0_g1_i1:95-802(+)